MFFYGTFLQEGKISNNAINRIIKYKSSKLEKITKELDKLLITYDFIDEKDILEHIYPELEESTFLFIDDLLNLRLTDRFVKNENLKYDLKGGFRCEIGDKKTVLLLKK